MKESIDLSLPPPLSAYSSMRGHYFKPQNISNSSIEIKQ